LAWPAFLALLLGRLAQMRRGGADDAERDDGVDVEHPLVRVVGHLVDRRVDRVARVVDDDVDLAPGVERRLHERVGRALLGQIAAVDRGLPGDLRCRLLGEIGVEVIDDHLGAVLAQQLRRRPADAAGGTGDDRHLVVQNSHAGGR
jgi:hypothetical protein